MLHLLALCACVTGSDPSTPTPGTPTPVGAPPVLDVMFPPSGDLSADDVDVVGTASDPDGGPVTVTLTGPTSSESVVLTAGSEDFRFADFDLGTSFSVELVVTVEDEDGRRTEHPIDLRHGPTLHQARQVVEDPDGWLVGDLTGFVRVTPDSREVVSTETFLLDLTRLGGELYGRLDGQVVRLDENLVPTELDLPEVQTLAPTPDGAFIARTPYNGSPPRSVYRIDPVAETAELLSTEQLSTTTFVTDGTLLYTWDFSEVISVSPASMQEQTILELDAPLTPPMGSIRVAAWVDDELWVADESAVFAIDVQTGDHRLLADVPGVLTLTATGSGALVGDLRGGVHRVDAAGTVTSVIDVDRGTGPLPVGNCQHVTSVPGETGVAVVCQTDDVLTILEVDARSGDRSLLHERTITSRIQGMARDPSGTRFILSDERGGVYAVDPDAGTEAMLVAQTFGSWGYLATDGTVAWTVRGEAEDCGSIVEVDLATGQREDVGFDCIRDFHHDPDTAQLFVLSGTGLSGSSGPRSLSRSPAIPGVPLDLQPFAELPYSARRLGSNGSVAVAVIDDSTLVRVDLASGGVTEDPLNEVVRPGELVPGPPGFWYGWDSSTNALFVLDDASGDVVLVSR